MPLATLPTPAGSLRYASVREAERQGLCNVSRLPYVLRVVLENLLRQRAFGAGARGDVETLASWPMCAASGACIQFRPARVMMDDTAGLPLLGELAAMRDAAMDLGQDESIIDLALPVDFIVDHSVIADYTGTRDALQRNMALEMKRNAERFQLLRWAEHTFPKLRVVPPGHGICHQINLEYLARVVCVERRGDDMLAYPDTMIGIDSHTPMINGLGVVGWGTSGIEGLATALGEPVRMRVPQVVGCELTGVLRAGVTATDLVLTLTRRLREAGVVGRVVEYFGPGMSALTVQDRATVANMTPEAGATMSYFPIDAATVRYLHATGRSAEHMAVVEAYAKAQGLWYEPDSATPRYDERLTFDLSQVEPSLAGPNLPHQRIALAAAPRAFGNDDRAALEHGTADGHLRDGDIVLAAITSCTNTSNPALMIGAGLLARNAVRRGLKVQPSVKTSLSPGSRVVADYLAQSGLQDALDQLGFHVVGYGCMTCVGFSGPLHADVEAAVRDRRVRAVAVYSGNRNFEGRAHPMIRSSFLASPPLVVAYALCGTILRDLTREPIGEDAAGRAVFLADVWPDPREVQDIVDSHVAPQLFAASYADLFEGGREWRALEFPRGRRFPWNTGSTFIQRPRTFTDARDATVFRDLHGARILAMYGDMVTTEHLSPMGTIPEDSQAARYLASLGVAPRDFVSYAARRLNDAVMTRGALASPHLVNALAADMPGGNTRHFPSGMPMTIFEAAERYRRDGVALVVIAGQAFGAGSSRDWSAKGPRALGVQAIIAESYERIYRSNLVAAGVLPLQFSAGTTPISLGLDGSESVVIEGFETLAPGATVVAVFTHAVRSPVRTELIARVDTDYEVEQIRHGGLLRMRVKATISTIP